MNMRAEFDLGPLSWIKGEIDLAVQRAREALRAFAATADDKQIKSSQTHLHQARGALQIVGLDGVTRLAEEIEGLLADMEKDAGLRRPEVFALADRALHGVLAYLEQLTAGSPNQPLKLYSLYRDVVAARGKQQPDPVDLYFPDLSLRPPRRETVPAGLKPEDADAQLRDQRGRYQRGFVKWLKNEPGGAEEMRDAVEAIEATQERGSQRAFWWVSLAFFDALAHKALPQDLDLKRLCNRIEQQIKRTVEGSPGVAERLMREALYYVARAKPVSDRVGQVQEVYRLAQTLPAEEDEKTTLVASPALKSSSARELLNQAKDAWNKFASGNQSSLSPFRDAATALQDSAGQLGNADIAGLAVEVAGLAAWLTGSKEKMSETVAIEVATALLLLESSLANFPNLGAEFTRQSQLLCSRLNDCVLGKPLRSAPEIMLLDEMARKAQEHLLMNQLVAEMQVNLRTIEHALDVFYRDSTKRDGLASIDKPMRQVLGAFDMLGEQRARDTLGAVDFDIRRFAEANYAPSQQDFERIAQMLSGLGFYIEALARGKADFDAVMQPISAKKSAEGLETTQPAATVEAQIAAQQRETATLYEEWKKMPDDKALKAELQKNLAALQKGAELVADQKLEASAEDALKVLDKSSTMPLTPFLAEAIGKIAPAASTPAPSPEAAKLIDASAGTVDAELLGIYLEESDEVIASLREHLDALRANNTDKDALTVIRRGFHTLKGSGRMVGLMRLGEAAWAIEQTLNLWLQEERTGTPDLNHLITAALDYFGDNVARLKAGGASSDEHALVTLAEKVRQGEALSGESAAPAAATPAPATTAAVTEMPMPPKPDEEFIQLGEHRISTTLFTIFSGEARAHLATITEELDTLRQHGVVTDTLLRAAHTLAGASGTIRLEGLRDLGYAFEKALQKLATSELSEEEQALVGEAVDQIEIMVADAIELRVPEPTPDLAARLEHVGRLPEEVPVMEAEPAVDAPLPDEPSGTPDVEETETAERERRQRRLDDDIDPELLPVFVDEAHELVPAVGAGVRDWRDHADNPQLGQALQRVLHTLKGSARMAGAMAIGQLTHNMENHVEHALALKILPATLFEEMETSYDRMNELFERLLNRAAAAGKESVPAPVAAVKAAAPEKAPPAAPLPLREEIAQRVAVLRVRADVVDRLVNEAGEVSIARSRIEGEMRALKTAMHELTENVARLRSQLREIDIQAESQMQSRKEFTKETERNFDPLEFDRFTRFQELTRLMAESVSDVQTVHQNLANAVGETDKALLAQARLNRDLQQDLMRVRMVQFGSISERLYRIVRQTAKEIGKRVNLEIRGTQVELDRSVLERITAPFEHLLRNAIAHGIEAPAARAAAGKKEIGEIRLDLAQEGNEIQISLSDDGAGLDIPRIRAKAIEQGLMQPQSALSEAEIADFIFNLGISTVAEVTQIAGRGVGMDVVRSEIAALGGRVELSFKRGQGTSFTIFLPLTLAVTQAVLVRAGAHTYAIPAVMVEQVMQYKQEQFEAAYRSPKIEWHDRHYSFHYLPHLLGASDAVAEQKRISPVLFLKSGTNVIALHVDEMVGGNQEIVVKALGPQLQRVAGITGATVLGSGEIVLILNPVLLAQREAAESAVVHQAPKPPAASLQPTIMVVDDSLTVRKVTSRLLERQGYLVVTARDGVEAMEKLQEIIPDAMLVDIEMPRMDGFDLTRHVRADARLAKVPIIMITSRTADKHQSYAREIGVNHFLGKPYQEDDLIGKIAGFLEERRVAA